MIYTYNVELHVCMPLSTVMPRTYHICILDASTKAYSYVAIAISITEITLNYASTWLYVANV